jgi:hypothetical protein
MIAEYGKVVGHQSSVNFTRIAMAIRDRVVSAVQSSNLRWDENHAKAIDVIAAMGMSNALGMALWRFKYANDATVYKRALELLIERSASTHKFPIENPFTYRYVFQLAQGAIKEWAIDICNQCQGTGKIESDEDEIDCPQCNGTGYRQYTDAERAHICGMAKWSAKLDREYREVMGCLMGAAAEVGGQMKRLLGD